MSSAKLLTPGGGGVILQPASSIASDVTVNVPVSGVNGGTLVSTDASGNVGIGTSAPGARLHVVGGDIQVSAGSSLKYSATAYITPEDNVQGARISAPGVISMWTGATPTEAARIDSGGNLLVGKTSTSNDVTTAGAFIRPFGKMVITATDSSEQNIVSAHASASGTVTAIQFFYNSTSVGTIQKTSTATSYNTSSDYRLKENIQPMQNALATVAQLNPVTYTWKADGSDGQGFIAHELQAVIPDAVSGEKDAINDDGKPIYQGVDTSFLVATLTAAIQEQQAMIQTLQAEVADLKSKVQA